jgi:hypothetical protein
MSWDRQQESGSAGLVSGDVATAPISAAVPNPDSDFDNQSERRLESPDRLRTDLVGASARAALPEPNAAERLSGAT